MKRLPCILFLMLALSSAGISFAQHISKHVWQHRLLVVLAKDTTQIDAQIQTLKKDLPGLKERKLLVYSLTPTAYKKGIESNTWIPSKRLYKASKETSKPFEVALIGLDGVVKLRQTEILSLEKLFTLIDGMPMRRSELRKHKN